MKTHIITLLPKDIDQNSYKDLEILPNMKLIELLDFNNSLFDFDITFNDGNPYNDYETYVTPFADKQTREGTLRLILSSFLYCLLENKIIENYNVPERHKRFLRLIVLMPNVYYQKKIYSIIKNLYNDFNKIIKNQRYAQYGGIEIQMISESDAAFVGTKKDPSIPRIDASNGYFLVIDAGKGTTDFSILKQYSNFSKFDSVYRAGIPTSGHLLTYAFYEAIRDYLNSKGITLNDKLLGAERATLLKFMECLETFKIYHSDIENNENNEINFNLDKKSSLDDIISFLNDNLIKNRIRIPNSKEKVEKKIEELTDEIEKAIEYGVKACPGFKNFEQVLLTGRGFLFDKFKEAVEDMLSKKGWVNDKQLVVSYSSDRAKYICLEGAFSSGRKVEINKNSELIGRPIIQRLEDKKKCWINKILKSKRIVNNSDELDTEFFYEGVRGITQQNLSVRIGGKEVDKFFEDQDEKRLYFIGDGFIFQTKYGIENIEEDYLNLQLTPLVMQTLFPFFKGSIPETETIATKKPSDKDKSSNKEEPKENAEKPKEDSQNQTSKDRAH